MKVRILKGTNTIGGCITEISTDKTRIIVDFGLDLDYDEKSSILEIEGLTYGQPSYDAIFITHSHGDHIGLIDRILPDIDVYVEPVSKKIYTLLEKFTGGKVPRKTIDLKPNVTLPVGDICITPYVVDHSAYNSLMFLIEADDRRVLHTGDYRRNGYKGSIFESTLRQIGKVDLVITEGTTLSRDVTKKMNEVELSWTATDIFLKYRQIFILQASTNVDRITSFYKAAKRTNKNFIEDIFTCNIVSSLDNKHIPNPIDFSNVYVWIPVRYKKKDIRFKNRFILPFEKYKSRKAYEKKNYAMMVKTSMLEDIMKLHGKGLIDNACLVYSMWNGYKENEETKKFIEALKMLGIEAIDLHVSGHADIETIEALCEIVKPSKVIGIHTTNSEKLFSIVDNVIDVEENEEVEV